MSFSVNCFVFCVPMLHISSFRSRVIALNTLNAEFITLCVKHRMAGKVPESKDLYKVSLCSNTIVSTWHERTESTSFAYRFVRLDPPLFLPSQSYVGTYQDKSYLQFSLYQFSILVLIIFPSYLVVVPSV